MWLVLLAAAALPHAALAQAPAVFAGKEDAPNFQQRQGVYPEGGEAFCVPVSLADGVVWLAEHGYALLPGRDQETALVTALAAKTHTDPMQGTMWSDGRAGVADFLDDFYAPDRIITDWRGTGSNSYPGAADWAWLREQVSRPDRVAVIERRRYFRTSYMGWNVYGAHAVFMSGYRSGAEDRMQLHDPLRPVPQDLAMWPQYSDEEIWYYKLDLPLAPPAGMPSDSEIEVRWSGAVVFGIAGEGDANKDGSVDHLDLGALAENYRGEGRSWGQADFNADGLVDYLDLGLLASHWHTAQPPDPPSLPEPLLVGLLPVLALLRRRR